MEISEKQKRIYRIVYVFLITMLIALVCLSAIYATATIVYSNNFNKAHDSIYEELAIANESLQEVDNIILLIGDGMSFNQIDAAKNQYELASLNMEKMPYSSQISTRSLSNKVTDSAAAATALATGCKTINNQVGKVFFTSLITSMDEAISKQMKTGIITTDDIYGATPAGFSAHALHRKNYDTIISSQLDSNIDYMISSVVSSDLTTAKKSEIEKKGYTYVNNFDSLPTKGSENKYYGIIPSLHSKYVDENNTPLVNVAENAIDYLENDKGFFLMIEGARIDKFNHKNNLEGMAAELIDFDETIKYCVDWARKHKNTVVIVTADHESGCLEITKDGFVYTSTKHSGVNVPIFTYGLCIDKPLYKNTDVFHMCSWLINL